MSEELLPCPFCGGTPKYKEWYMDEEKKKGLIWWDKSQWTEIGEL